MEVKKNNNSKGDRQTIFPVKFGEIPTRGLGDVYNKLLNGGRTADIRGSLKL